MNWKAVKTLSGVAVGIRRGEYMIVKEQFPDEDQFHVMKDGKLVAVCPDAELAKALCDPIPEMTFAENCDLQSGGGR